MATIEYAQKDMTRVVTDLARKATWYEEILYGLHKLTIDTPYHGKIKIAEVGVMDWVVAVGKKETFYGNPSDAANAFITEVMKARTDASPSEPKTTD